MTDMTKYFIAIFIVLSFFVYFTSSFSYAQAENKVIELSPSDDAYVATDRYDPQDIQGLNKINTGNLPFLKVWNAWNVTATGKQYITSVVYLKFDLTNVKSDNIESASLILSPFVMNLTSTSRQVDAYTALDSNWNESTITYGTAPRVSADQNSTSIIDPSSINKNVSWDITKQVKSHAGSFLTLALLLKLSFLHNEEIVDFYSKESTDPLTKPKLELVTMPETIFGGTDSSYGYVIGGIIVVAVAIGGFVIIKRKKKNSASPDNKSSSVQTTSSLPRQESDTKQATGKQKSDMSATILCKACGKLILRDFKVCPYCASQQNTNN
jgi:LPXTG-motif cell wall-anchored protein